MSKPDINAILRQNLTQAQYEATIDDSKDILCLACAGSGKSRTLAFKIARLVANGIVPNKIVAFTFTEKAADSIKRRIAEALVEFEINPAILGAMYIGTIHSYCKHLLGEMDATYRQFSVLDANMIKLYLMSRYAKLGLTKAKQEKNVGYFAGITEIANAWNTLNDEMLNIEDIETHDSTLASILNNLKTFLISDQYFDFSLMIRLVVDAMENDNPIVNNALENLDYLFVDEYQDINPVQDALIRGIRKRNTSIFVVGDDDQSIYAWRGADVNHILDFENTYPDCSVHKLSTNFRSTPQIIQVSSNFVEEQLGPNRMSKDAKWADENSNLPQQIGSMWFDNRGDEATWVAQRIFDMRGTSYKEKESESRGLCPSDFAILMPSTKSEEGGRGTGIYRHTAFIEALKKLDIPYTIESQGSIFRREIANTIRNTFELLRENNLDRDKLREFFNNEIKISFPNADFSKTSNVLSEWQRHIHQPIQGARRKISPQQLLYDVLKAFSVDNTDLTDVNMQILGIFSKIMSDIESVYVSIDSTYRFQQILNFLNHLAEDGYVLSPDEVIQRPNAVFVSTIHQAKGLEFPVVFIVDVENQRLPGKKSNYRGWLPNILLELALSRGRYQNTRAGDIRLFYTAITRAERYLYISGCKSLPMGKKEWKKSVFSEIIEKHSEVITDPNVPPESIDGKEQEKRRIEEDLVPTTYSQIKYYLTCPKNYQYRQQYGFSAPVPDLFGFGETTHSSISKLHQEFRIQAPTETDAEKIADSNFNLKHAIPSKDPENSPGPYERAKRKSVEIVKNYVKDYGDHDFVRERQVEVRFEIPADHSIISGSIDLLLKEDEEGKILESKVIDFKSMEEPDQKNYLDWTDLSLQVQLYAYAADKVLNDKAKTGAVHLLGNKQGKKSRIDVPITKEAIKSAIDNVEWAVKKIKEGQYPMRPHLNKCENCDFTLICSKKHEEFIGSGKPLPIHVPTSVSQNPIMSKAFSEIS